MSKINLGISLFSFTQDYAKQELTLEDTMRIASEIGATGIEVVGSQMLDTYPFATAEFIDRFKRLCIKHSLEPICYGANTDRGMLFDRDLNEDELFSSTLIDLQTASQLGFSIMRVQFLLSASVLKRLEPYARKYGVKLGIEIHNPETPSTPKILDYLALFESIDSEFLGFIPDFGSFATKPNKPHWDQALADGVELEVLELAAKMKYEGVSQKEAFEVISKMDTTPSLMMALSGMYGFVTFYQTPDLEGLQRIMKYCIHFHGKFHFIDKNLVEASIPYKDILDVIYNSNFSGYIMTEYEDQSGPSEMMINRHIEMEKRILKELEATS